MYDKKRSGIGKWKRTLTAFAVTASVILALPAWSVGRAEASPELVRPESCSLTIKRASDSTAQADIVVDLYKVANAEDLPGYDAYTLALNAPYDTPELAASLEAAKEQENGASVSDGGNALYRTMAQDVAKIALAVEEKEETKEDGTKVTVKGPAQEPSRTATMNSGENTLKIPGIDPGMYLVVAHGSGMNVAQYTTQVGEGTDKQLATMAYSDEYVYTYLPELIALPSRGSAPAGSFNTADNDLEWSSDVTATLKSEQASRLTSLQIGKTFTVSEDAVIAGGDGCVFQIEATLNDEIVYSNVAAIPYEGRATGSVTLSKVIPVGAEVTVTEVYSGAAFTVSGEEVKSIVAEADREDGTIENNVFFTNNSNGIGTSGDIVTNSFTHGADGWTWNDPKPTQAQPETPEQ